MFIKGNVYKTKHLAERMFTIAEGMIIERNSLSRGKILVKEMFSKNLLGPRSQNGVMSK